MKKLALLLLVIPLVGGGYYYYEMQFSSSFLKKATIRIAGKDEPVRSQAGLKERGLKLRLIPNGRNAAITYIEASNAYRKARRGYEGLVAYVAANEWISGGRFGRWFKSNEKCLGLLHKATGKPDCQFPYFGEDDRYIASVIPPHLPIMPELTQLLVCEGKQYEHDGDYSAALDCYFAATKVAEHLNKSESFAYAKSVAVACYGIANQAVERCVASGKLSEADLRHVVQRYEEILGQWPQLADTIEAERVSADDLIKEIREHPASAMHVLSGITPEQAQMLSQLIRREESEIKKRRAKVWAALEKWCALPTWQAFRPGNDWDAYLDTLPSSHIILRPALGKVRRLYAMGEAETGGVMLFAAIKLYEKKNGRTPSSLRELKGDTISKLPKDPFSGRDYAYKVQGNDWIVYSVSGDLTDNGGVGQMPHNHGEDKDIVFWSKPIPVEPPPQ